MRAGPFMFRSCSTIQVFQQPIRARLFQADEDGRDWGTGPKKRDEQE